MNTEAVLAYLRKQQSPDGSFVGWASARIEPFSPTRSQPTIFPTMIILDCLHDVVGAEDIRLRAVKYLESQVSEQGSWNYWDRSSTAKDKEPYPDDLDDTAYALAAITRADPKWTDGYRLGQLARLLIASEQNPGGPYNTWLIDTEKAAQWRHVDIAVNANVGYALSLHDVHLAGLTQYIDAALRGNKFQSDYYTGEAAVLYFLSRWYAGEQLPKLRNMIEHCMAGNALEAALLLSAGCNVGVDEKHLAQLAQNLVRQRTADHWPAAALYVDPVYDKKQHYGGSDAITTAFALEALTSHENHRAAKPSVISRKHGVPQLMVTVRADAKSIQNVSLRRRYESLARRLTQDVAGEQITAPASLVGRASNWKVPETTLLKLDAAGLNGWMAYTMYDDILDGDADPANLTIANVSLRRSQQHFLAALPDQPDWPSYIMSVFDAIDGANHWEQLESRTTVKGGTMELRHLPNYGDYSQLANRSLGHGLAACGVAVMHYGSLDHPKVRALQTFFKHFLIARQLNDDAHDWEQDLQVGHLSAVATMLVKDMYEPPHRLMLDEELDSLRQYFWQHTIGTVATLIREHLQKAEQALHDLENDMRTAVFAGWLDTLEASVAAALHGRNEALQFMQAYEGSNV